MLKEIKKINAYLEKEEGISLEQVVGYFEYGSTYQGTNDEYSDKDIMVVYVTKLEYMLFNKSDIKSKKIETSDFGIVLVPLQEYYHLFKKGSYDSYLKLDAMLEGEYSEELKEIFGCFYDNKTYEVFVEKNKWLLLNSLKGNLKGYIKTFETKGMDGKLYIKIHYLLSMYSKLEIGDIKSCKFIKLDSYISKQITPYKRMTVSELERIKDLNICSKYGYKGIEGKIKIDSIKEFKEYCYEILGYIEEYLKVYDKDEYKGKTETNISKEIEFKIKEKYLSKI